MKIGIGSRTFTLSIATNCAIVLEVTDARYTRSGWNIPVSS